MPWPFKKKAVTLPNQPAPDGDEAPMVSYWTYFDDRAAADGAAERLRAQELTAEARPSAAGDQFLVLASIPLPPSEEEVERNSQVVKSVAASLGGQYDGWEAGPLPDDQTADRIRSWLEKGVGSP